MTQYKNIGHFVILTCCIFIAILCVVVVMVSVIMPSMVMLSS